MFTWDYHSSISFWSGLRVQPILSDEVQTFKALITVHKVLQEGHPVVCEAASHSILVAKLRVVSRQSRRLRPRLAGSSRALVLLAMIAEEVRSSCLRPPVGSHAAAQGTERSSAHTCNSYWQSFDSTVFAQNSMVSSNTRSMSRSRVSMIRMKGSCVRFCVTTASSSYIP